MQKNFHESHNLNDDFNATILQNDDFNVTIFTHQSTKVVARYFSKFIALIIEISFVKKFLHNLVEKYTIL